MFGENHQEAQCVSERKMPSSQETSPQTQDMDMEDIIPGRLSQSQWRDMLMQEDTEETVGIIMDEMLRCVMEFCLKADIERQLVPYSASWARNHLVQLLERQFLYRDEGDGPQEASRTEDSEPVPGTADAWAQGCVPVANATPTPTTFPSTYRERAANGRLAVMSHASSSLKQSKKEKSPSKPGGEKNYRVLPPPKSDPKKKPQNRRELTLPLSSSAEKPGQTESRPIPQNNIMAHASSSPKQYEKQTSPRTPRGDKSYRHLSPLPPLKSAQKKTSQGRLPPKVVVEKCTLSLPSSSEKLGRLEVEGESRTSSVPLYRRKDQPIQKLDPSCLPRHSITPQYEILDTNCEKPQTKRPSGVAKLEQRCNKQKTERTISSPKPLTLDVDQPAKFQARNGADVWLKTLSPSRRRREGIVLFSDSVRLDTMDLAPGVSLRDPQAVELEPNKLCPPVQSTKLRPIRHDAVVPQVSGLRSPQVTPMFQS